MNTVKVQRLFIVTTTLTLLAYGGPTAGLLKEQWVVSNYQGLISTVSVSWSGSFPGQGDV